MKNLKWVFAITLALLLFGTNSYATNYDFGDAPGYADVMHSDPSWQRLGILWDSESSAKAVDSSDDGVSWSTDGGTTWGNSEILAGGTVTFKFDMYKDEWGEHDFDALKVWIDWNQDQDFIDSGEMILTDQWNFKTDPGNSGQTPTTTYAYGDGLAQITKSFYHNIFIPENSILGDYWLRARVACNADIRSNFDNMTPTGYIYQGEVEDWKFTVKSVPEPATAFLLGIGLFGLATVGRKRLFKK